METTFYEDQSFTNTTGKDGVNMLKKKMTLDLDMRGAKRPKLNSILTSPDLHMLKLDSPELEKLIIQHNGIVSTPSTTAPTSSFPQRNVTEEQELFAKGFVDQLTHLQAQDVTVPMLHPPTTLHPPTSSYKPTYTNLDQPLADEMPPINIKEEPQTVPSMGDTPPLSPINMQEQEEIKLARKRLRNRLAASKCRRRKLERISRLEDKVSELKSDNGELSGLVSKLREQVCALKQEVMEHVNSGCQIMTTTTGAY